MLARMISDSSMEQNRMELQELDVQSKVKKKTKTKTEFPMKWTIVTTLRPEKVLTK